MKPQIMSLVELINFKKNQVIVSKQLDVVVKKTTFIKYLVWIALGKPRVLYGEKAFF